MQQFLTKISTLANQADYYIGNLKIGISPLFILDIVIVSVVFYWAYIFLKETRALRILYGLFVLLLFVALGKLLNLVLLNWILKSFATILVVAIPVVFQPELRTALEKLGRTKFLGELVFSKDEDERTLREIVKAVEYFTSSKIGALIVIKRQTGLKEFIDSGTILNSRISHKLLGSIFYPKSPLHDGAVIISGGRILSAGSILPVSQLSLGGNMGTRHKAGLGITEISDALAVIVSEETGKVSLAVGGKMETKLTLDQLKARLYYHTRHDRKDK